MDPLIAKLQAIVGDKAVLSDPDELLVYECDGLPQHKHLPRAVVFPSSTKEVSEVMQTLSRNSVPFTPRGAGTGLSGGALAVKQGVVIELARMRRILKIDPENRIAVVQPGVVNLHISQAAAEFGLYYVPDPSSQPTCTIGGNIAENAGGIHCLKYGTTTDHVLSVVAVLSEGQIVELTGGETEPGGFDLLGIFVGSEGTFGITTEATLRLTRMPPSVRTLLAEFSEVNDASHAVSAIIAAGVMPAALEMMDHEIIRAVEASIFSAGLPLDIGAALLIELDGLEAGIDQEAARVSGICLRYGARSCRLARDEMERKKLWAARKGAFGAIGRIAPDSMIQDAVVPRSRLPEILDEAYKIAAKYRLRLANVFHAGDGNLHPLICFDSRSTEEVHRVKEAGRELMEACVRAGGSITGEHGVGLDKRDLLPLVFSTDDMEAMLRVRAAFDPLGNCNPGKIIPVLRGCGEARAIEKTGRKTEERGQGGTGERGYGGTGKRGTGQLAKDVTTARTPSTESTASAVSRKDRTAPNSTAEVCETVRTAAANSRHLLPVGGESWSEVGNPLNHIDVVLQTTRLNRILEHEPKDLMATAEAGVTLNTFNQALAQNGQWLPLDPPDDGRGTIGGIVATGTAGALKLGYGPPRRYVIGLKVVLPDGTMIKAGGRVVKNVAGYDLCKLFTGSYGTLGVITEVTFKLRPVPEQTRTIVAWGDAATLLQATGTIRGASSFPVALEMVSPDLTVAMEMNLPRQHGIFVRFAGSEDAVDFEIKATLRLLRQDGVQADVIPGNDWTFWRQLAAVPLRLRDRLTFRLTVLTTELPKFIRRISSLPSSSLWTANVAEGRLRVLCESDDEDVQIKALMSLRRDAQQAGGSLIIEDGPERIKQSIDAWGTAGPQLKLASRIKRQIDPLDLFSPGRFRFDGTD